MYCQNCSAPVAPGSTFCNACGAPVGAGNKFCGNCAWPRDPKETACSRCGTPLTGSASFKSAAPIPGGQPGGQYVPPGQAPQGGQPSENPAYVNVTGGTQKSKVLAGVLGIILGCFGVHNFYLGYTAKAVTQLLITVLTCGIGAIGTSIWGLVEGIMILNGNINVDASGMPLGD